MTSKLLQNHRPIVAQKQSAQIKFWNVLLHTPIQIDLLFIIISDFEMNLELLPLWLIKADIQFWIIITFRRSRNFQW